MTFSIGMSVYPAPPMTRLPAFRIVTDRTGPVVEIALHGELDLATVDEALAAFEQSVDGQPEVVVDLSGLTFMDSTGVRLLLRLHGRQNGRRVRFAQPSPQVARILELTGIGPVFDWLDDDM